MVAQFSTGILAHFSISIYTHIQVWIDTESRYKDISISTVTLDKLIEDEKAWTFDDETFDKVNPETGLPYGYEPTKKERHEYSIVEETV